MKRKKLSLGRNFRSETEIEDTYSNFDVDDLEFLEKKVLVDNFEALRQSPSVSTLQLKKTNEQLKSFKLKEQSNDIISTGKTKNDFTIVDQSKDGDLKIELVDHQKLALNNALKVINKNIDEHQSLVGDAKVNVKSNRNIKVSLLTSKNILSEINKNIDITTDNETTEIDNHIIATPELTVPLSFSIEEKLEQTDINNFEFEESIKQDTLLLINDPSNDKKDDAFQYNWDDDKLDEAPNEDDFSLDFLNDIDFDEVIDTSEPLFLGTLNENSDELVSFLQRARQAANNVTQEFGLSTDSFKLLCDIFFENGWGPCRIAITRQLNYGRSIKEIWNAHEVREIWRGMQDVWQLDKNIPARLDDFRRKQKKTIDARKGLLEIYKLIRSADTLYSNEPPPINKSIKQLQNSNLVSVKKTSSNTMSWIFALNLVDFLDIQSVDSDFVTEFFCCMHQGWLNLVKNNQWPIRFEIYLYHRVSEMPVSWRELAPLPNEELWWNDKPSYSEDPFLLDYLMGRCCGDSTYDYMDIKEQFDEL